MLSDQRVKNLQTPKLILLDLLLLFQSFIFKHKLNLDLNEALLEPY